MNHPTTVPASLTARFEIAEDVDGKLFQPGARQDLAVYQAEGVLASGPGGTAGLEAFLAMKMAAKFMHLAVESWAESHGLSEGRLQVLLALRHRPEGMTLGRLAQILQVSPRNITGLVDNLERDGLVERVPDPGDRRSILARPTPAGSQRINSIWRQALSQHLPVMQGFSLAELVELRHLCLRLVLNLKTQLGSRVG